MKNLQMLEAERFIKERIKSIETQMKVEKPNLFKQYKFRADTIVFERRPPGSSKVVPDLVRLMLKPHGASKTQKLLIEEISEKHPEQPISKGIWHNKLPKYHKEAIKKILNDEGMPERLLKGVTKLSQLKKNLQNYFLVKEGNPRQFKAEISFQKERVTINNKSYQITRRGKNNNPCVRVSRHGKRYWVRVDHLGALLLDAED